MEETTADHADDSDQSEEEDSEDDCDANFPWRRIRLPHRIKPINYRLHLQPNLSQLTFLGRVEIELEVISLDFDGLLIKIYEYINVTLKLPDFFTTDCFSGYKQNRFYCFTCLAIIECFFMVNSYVLAYTTPKTCKNFRCFFFGFYQIFFPYFLFFND